MTLYSIIKTIHIVSATILFDWLDSAHSGFHMQLTGTDQYNNPKKICFELIARNGDGPYIPCIPAILLTKKLARDELKFTGAQPCIGMINRDEYLCALQKFKITWTDN